MICFYKFSSMHIHQPAKHPFPKLNKTTVKRQKFGSTVFPVPGRQHGLLTKITTVFSWDKSKIVFPPHNPNCGKTQTGFCSWERFWHRLSGLVASIISSTNGMLTCSWKMLKHLFSN